MNYIMIHIMYEVMFARMKFEGFGYKEQRSNYMLFLYCSQMWLHF
jgi:hypothetical protein